MIESQKKIVVVLGSHRCGTSALTHSLNVLGIHLGCNLNPPEPGVNDTGFWEDLDIVRLNDHLLETFEQSWCSIMPLDLSNFRGKLAEPELKTAVELLQSKFSNTDIFGIKDPRMAKLLPFWQQVFARLDLQVSYIIACRHPMSAALSLAKRDHFPAFKAHWLWYGHLLASLYYTQNVPRLIVDYDQLMSHPKEQLARMSDYLGIPLQDHSPELRSYIEDFLTDSLRHSQFTFQDLELAPGVPQEVKALYGLLQQLIENNIDHQSATAWVNAAWIKHTEFHPLLNLVENQVGAQALQIKNLEKSVDELRSDIRALFGSTSWRITRPLRALSQLLKRQTKKEQPCRA